MTTRCYSLMYLYENYFSDFFFFCFPWQKIGGVRDVYAGIWAGGTVVEKTVHNTFYYIFFFIGPRRHCISIAIFFSPHTGLTTSEHFSDSDWIMSGWCLTVRYYSV